VILHHLAGRLLHELDSPESVGWAFSSLGLWVVARWRKPGWAIGFVAQSIGVATGHLVCLVALGIYVRHFWVRRHEPFLRAVPPPGRTTCTNCCVHGRVPVHAGTGDGS